MQTIDKMTTCLEANQFYSSSNTPAESSGNTSIVSSEILTAIEQIKMNDRNEDRYKPGDVVCGF
jgi:hypothetical protein